MTRSRAEIISEMVDSGLFTDDEIRQAVSVQSPIKARSLNEFAGNATKDYVDNIRGQAELASYAFPPLAAMKAAAGENIYDPERLKSLGNQVVKGALGTPKRLLNIVRNPVEAIYQKPLSTALDVGTVASVAGAGARLVKPIVTSRQLESLAGTAPGALEATYKEPGLIGAPGKKAVQELYNESKASTGGGFRQSLKEIPDKKAFVDEALKIAKKGELTPAEALEARKTLDSVKKQVTGPFFENARNIFDQTAKIAFDKADTAYQRAVKAESLRNLFPQNKYGGASAFKLGMITALEGMAENLGLPGKVVARIVGAAMSPAATGLAAATAGKVAKLTPLSLIGPGSVAATAKEGKPETSVKSLGFKKAIDETANTGKRNGNKVPESKADKNASGNLSNVKKDRNPVQDKPPVKTLKKTLTEEKAKEYLKKAKGDRQKARALATKDGWQIPS